MPKSVQVFLTIRAKTNALDICVFFVMFPNKYSIVQFNDGSIAALGMMLHVPFGYRHTVFVYNN